MHVSQKKNRIYTCVCDKMRWPFHFCAYAFLPGVRVRMDDWTDAQPQLLHVAYTRERGRAEKRSTVCSLYPSWMDISDFLVYRSFRSAIVFAYSTHALLLTRSIVRRRRPGHMGGRGALARAVTDRYPSASRYHAGGGGAGGVAPPLRSRGPAGRGRDIRRAVGHAACAQGRGNYVCVSRTIWQTRPPDMHA